MSLIEKTAILVSCSYTTNYQIVGLHFGSQMKNCNAEEIRIKLSLLCSNRTWA